jgi:hypothetical protein
MNAAILLAGLFGRPSPPVEVEIFNEGVWQMPAREIIQKVCACYLEAV